MTQMLNVTHQTPAFGPAPRSRIRPLVGRSLIVTLAAGALISSAYAPAFAVDTPAQGVVANVSVDSIISLTDLTADFTLLGIPGGPSNTATVDYRVETNNVAGYSVSVTPQVPVLVGTGGNQDTIPVEALIAYDITTGLNTPIAPSGSTTVHSSNTRTQAGGEALSTSYSMDIPFVNSDNYSVTLDYVASTL